MVEDLFFRRRIILALVGLAVVAGILLAQWIGKRTLHETNQDISQSGPQNIISEIVLAALVDPNQRDRQDPALQQSTYYTTANFLALRITTRPEITSPIQLNARLRTDSGSIVELDPPSMTLPPGESTFCCWQVVQEGTYTLQLFRPEGIITSIPLRIRQASGTNVRVFQGL